MTELPDRTEEDLYQRVARIVEAARGHVARSVNTAMVHAYWLIGREIVEVEQQGEQRAGYGEELLDRLAGRLARRFGKGFSARTLRRIRQFYLTYPRGSLLSPEQGDTAKRPAALSESVSGEIRSAPLTNFVPGEKPLFSPDLGWSHYLILMRIEKPEARAFYEIEAVREGWSTRELERQIAALLFDRLESFLLELGKGFCFVARQKRITLEGDHFYVDLVFYNRLLRCFVLVELKLGKLTHQDLGQLQMYVHYYDRYQREEGEAPTVGILLCSEKNDAMVRITLPDGEQQIHTARYQLYLPSETELREALVSERERLERAKRADGQLSGDADDGPDTGDA